MFKTDRPLLWGDKRYHSLNHHLRNKYGGKVFKIPLDAGFTCPNRDGTLSSSGCLFCSPRGSGDFAGARRLDLVQQFTEVKTIMHRKWPQAKYIAYFQAFSNTYDHPQRLRDLYLQAAAQPGVVGLAIATRPDCLPPEVIEVLDEVKCHTELWVELGLQTIHAATARDMNLRYEQADFENAVQILGRHNIDICAHIILGLPGESREDMMATAHYVAQCRLAGIKIHLLHVMKNTPLGISYQEQPFRILDQEEYVNLVAEILEILPPEMVVHRLTGDSPRHLLLVPQWSLHKREVLNQIERVLLEKETWQGRLYSNSCRKGPETN